MGIQGLLPNLASITKVVHLRDFANLRIGVDAYVWLHKATYCCSYELCNNIPTDKYIQYCLKWVRMLQSFSIIPILVFDGGHLPVKGDKEIERRTRREDYKKKAAECMSKGDKRGAYEHYQKCVDVTPKMAFNLIKALQMINVQYIVSPYEADAQLAYLARNNMVDAVITEDSDLIPYGASRIIFKLDKNGNGKELRLADLNEVRELDFSAFTRDMLRHMCILSGCDYAGSISGLGVKKAHALLKKYKDIEKVFKAIKLDKALTMPKDYEISFKKADLTFLHQRVYDPVQRKIVTLTPLPDDIIDPEQDWNFLGPELADDVGRRIAEGILNPHTKQPFENDTPTYNPNRLTANKKVVGKEVKIYAQKRRAMTSSAKNTPVGQKNTISNYFATKSTSSLSVSLNNSVSQGEDNTVFDEESNDSGLLPNMAKSTASMDYYDDDFSNVDLDALFENSLGSANNNSNSNHSAEPQSSVNNEEEVKDENSDRRQDVILAPATPSPKKVFIVRSKYFDPSTPQSASKLDESTDLLLKSLSKSRDVDQDDIFASLDEEDKIAEDDDFETPKNRSTERMMRDMNKPLTSTPKLARNLTTQFLAIDKSLDNSNSDGSLSPMGSDDVLIDEKGAKKSPFFQVPFKPFSSPLVKSTGRLSLRTTQTIKSSSVVTKVITDNDDVEEVDTKITLTKSSSTLSIFRTKDSYGDAVAEMADNAKNSAGDSSENNSEDKHNKSDENLFESASKELNTNTNNNNNNENSPDSLDDFDVKPAPKPKKKVDPPSESSSLDSDKENSPVVEPKKTSLFEKLNLNRFSFKRKDREGDTEEQQPATKKLKTSTTSVSRLSFVNSSSSAIVIDD